MAETASSEYLDMDQRDLNIRRRILVGAPSAPYEKSFKDVVRKRSTVSIALDVKQRYKENLEITEKSGDGKLSVEVDPHAPKDNCYFVLVVVTVMGLVHFVPSTYFTTANEYWMYKFRNISLNTTEADQRTYLQKNFVSLTIAYNAIPSLLATFLSTFVAHKISAKVRVLGTLILHSSIFTVLVIFVKINTDNWQQVFFAVTMTLVIIVNCTINIGGSGEYNIITKLPSMYIKGFLHGEGTAGFFNGVIRLISVASSPTAIGSAMIYFVTGAALLIMTSIMTALSFKTDFIRHYAQGVKEERKESIRGMTDFITTLKLIWPMILLNGLMMAVPTSAIYNLVVSEHQGDNGTVWGNEYFVTVCTFLIPAAINVFGRAAYNKTDWDCPLWLQFILVISYQIIFTVLIAFSNAQPRNHLAVWMTHDWEYAISISLWAFSKGFLSNMVIIKTVKMVPQNRTEFAMLIVYFTDSIWGLIFSPLGVLFVNLL